MLFHNFISMGFNKLFKGIAFLSVFVASIVLCSCHKDNNGGNQGGETETTACKAGDDFFTYANAEWLKSLEGTESQGWQGFLYDIARANSAKVQVVMEAMPEYKALKQAGANREKNLEASVLLVEEIASGLLADATTKEEAYIAIGKAIRLGIPSIATLHTARCREDNTLGFYFMLPCPNEEEEESVSGVHSTTATDYHVASKRLSRYVQDTRSGKTTIDYILEGIGLDPKHYLYDDITTDFVAELEQIDTKEILKNIGDAVLAELLCYCSDDYARQYTEGEVNSVEEYISRSLQYDLGYCISYYFSQAYPTDSAEPAFSALGDELIASFRKRLESNQWLSPATQQAAIEKLDHMGKHYGTPKRWPAADLPHLKGELLVADVLDLRQSRYNTIKSLLGKSADEYFPIFYIFYSPDEPIYTYTANAFYDAAYNAFYVLPAYMLEPAYTTAMDECQLYATWGMTIGHEITHGFDQRGATYDKNGDKNNWWTDVDAAKFAELNALRIENVSSHEILPGVQAYGAQTVIEDVADLGGFNIAYDYWVNKLKERGVKGDELKEMKRAFFLHFATMYSEKLSDNDMLARAASDVHSAGHIRINSVVQHIDDWYELFDVVEGDALYLAPEQRITIW